MRTRTRNPRAALAALAAPTALLAALMPATASAAPLWTSLPKPFTCGPGGKVVADNSCVRHTGFRPDAGSGPYGPWWGQARSSRGNCTAYVAYRLIRNGASNFLVPGQGRAVHWRRHAKNAGKAVDPRPAVGAVAWWDANSPGVGSAGHVAYVERVSADGRVVHLSESHYPLGFSGGSRRLIVRRGDAYWPTRFLHVKDKPKPKRRPRSGRPAPDPSGPGLAPSEPLPEPELPEPDPGSEPPPDGPADQVGPPATDEAPSTHEPSTSKPSRKPSVRIAKGGSAQGMPGCRSVYCRYIVVKFTDFPSGTHSIKCRASHGSEGGYYTYKRSGSSNTSAYCYYGFPGHSVWVTVDGVGSNRIAW